MSELLHFMTFKRTKSQWRILLFFGASTAARILSNEEIGYIAQNGPLGTAGIAVTATGNVGVTVLGSLVSTASIWLLHSGAALDVFVGTGAEVRAGINGGNTIVRVDVDGDGSADMKIVVSGVAGLTEGDFIL